MIEQELTAAAQRGVRLDLAPVGRHSRVAVDGQDISRYVQRAIVDTPAEGLTQVTLECVAIDKDATHFEIAGYLLPKPSTPARWYHALLRAEPYLQHAEWCSRDYRCCTCGLVDLQAEIRTVLQLDIAPDAGAPSAQAPA